MTKKPLFSIIIPTYNCAEKLRYALYSVERQSFKDFEVIVCDDGSSDHTKQVTGAFSDKFDIKYLWQEHWGGPARPRNNGIKVASGDYIAFLDSDDWWYPNKLEIVKNHLNNTDVLYHDLDIYTPGGKRLFKKVKSRHLKKPIFVDLMMNGNALTTSGVVARKGVVKQVGAITEGFLTCVEDFDLWLKIARVTDKFSYIPKSLGAYWMGKGSVSEPSDKVVMRTSFVYEKYLTFLKGDDRKRSEAFLKYLLGRIKQKAGMPADSLKFFKQSASSKDTGIKIKSIVWILFLGIFHKFIKITKRQWIS